jgi:hypothetical protein
MVQALISKGYPCFKAMSLTPLFAIYGQPGVPMDFLLLTLFHALFVIPFHIVLFRWRAQSGYTSYYAKDYYVVKDA